MSMARHHLKASNEYDNVSYRSNTQVKVQVTDLTMQDSAANLNKLRQLPGENLPTIGKINCSTKLKGQSTELQL